MRRLPSPPSPLRGCLRGPHIPSQPRSRNQTPLWNLRPSRFQSRSRAFATGTPSPSSRAERILSRLPRRLQRYTTQLRSAPVSHLVAFLVLHEITAVAPLVGLFGVFHYTDFVPVSYVLEHYGGYVREGIRRFESYFQRKGWFGFGTAEGEETGAAEARGVVLRNRQDDDVLRRWEGADAKYRTVVEVALAYAVTKALLPLRIVASVWATPWFAGALGRIRRAIAPK